METRICGTRLHSPSKPSPGHSCLTDELVILKIFRETVDIHFHVKGYSLTIPRRPGTALSKGEETQAVPLGAHI